MNQIIMNIAGKIRVEEQDKLRKEARAEATIKSRHLESTLVEELESQVCPVCFDDMAPPKCPMIVSPCGHTLCNVCLSSIEKMRKVQCPLCRSDIVTKAVNMALQQVLRIYSSRAQQLKPQQQQLTGDIDLDSLLETSDAAAARDEAMVRKYARPEAASAAIKYLREYHNLSSRCSLLSGELQQCQRDYVAVTHYTQQADPVLKQIERDEASLLNQIEQLQEQLKYVRTQKAEQEKRRKETVRLQEQAEAREQMIRDTLEPLLLEREKAKLFVQNFAPGLQLE
eukprot:TRINITY_DN4733_c0_g1_i3.p1 TRINITY_DN4733_c0_g1~~TRINITY_DN4733_c0_g1_i3.p1  ORF type:complete len:283 (+),score=91.76 TRINITY_DN4733_c0_g1_i3:232-1080(+)